METIFGYAIGLVLQAVVPILIIAVAQAVLYHWKKARGQQPSVTHHVMLAVFMAYVLVLLMATTNYATLLFGGGFSMMGYTGCNLVPFAGIRAVLNTGGSYATLNILGNILMFLPFGLLLPLLFDGAESFLVTVFSGAAVSFLIELSQLFTRRGTDIDDVLLNTFGVICGYLLFLLVCTVVPTFIAKVRPQAHAHDRESRQSLPYYPDHNL